MKVFAVIAATVAVASAQSLAVKKWTPVNFGAARGHNCLTANGKAAKLSRDCDIQASAYPKLCVSVGGQCGMSLADAEANCGAIEGCAGVFCAPYYSDATRCLARSKAEFAGKYIHRVKGVYNKIKRAPIERAPIKKAPSAPSPSKKGPKVPSLKATSKIDAHATKTSAVVQKVVKKAPAFKNVKNVATRAQKVDNEIKRAPIKIERKPLAKITPDSCSQVELEALQEKFWPYYQKVNGDYDAKKSGRIDMKAIAHYKFLHQKCGDQAYMKVDRRADQAYMKVDRQCGETSECAFEWKSQRWGKKTWTSHCQAKLWGGYHIDCHTCDWCERKAPDGQIVRKMPSATAAFKNVKNVATRAAKIDEPRKHFKLCDAQNCANWECKEWCHCFDEKAEHLGLYEHHGCDEDDSSGACECETTGNGATFSGEDQMFLKKRNHELMKKTTKTAWSADMKRLAPRVKTMEIAAKHKFVAAKHK